MHSFGTNNISFFRGNAFFHPVYNRLQFVNIVTSVDDEHGSERILVAAFAPQSTLNRFIGFVVRVITSLSKIVCGRFQSRNQCGGDLATGNRNQVV